MLDVKLMFQSIATWENSSLKALANRCGIQSYPSFCSKISTKAESLKLSTLESLIHRLGYKMVVQIIASNGEVVYNAMSDPNKQLVPEDKLVARQDRRRELIKQNMPDQAYKDYESVEATEKP